MNLRVQETGLIFLCVGLRRLELAEIFGAGRYLLVWQCLDRYVRAMEGRMAMPRVRDLLAL